MKPFKSDYFLIFVIFALSRIIFYFNGIHFEYNALFEYWQYLDVDTLKNNLLKGIFFNHSQPPFFNLFLGLILKIAGDQAEIVFSIIFKLIGLLNTLILYTLTQRISKNRFFSLAITGVFLLSPATVIFENELFYTSFVSLLLLLLCNYLMNILDENKASDLVIFFLLLTIICLTRSMYHLVLMIIISLILIKYFKNTKLRNRTIYYAMIAILFVSSWYYKNQILFGNFGTSSWIGMNLSRNVFHNINVNDSNKISYIAPFSGIAEYNKFINQENFKPYIGMNDKDLFSLYKNDSVLNRNHIGYISVSKIYLSESIQQIKANPIAYLKNVSQSFLSFFTPATTYPFARVNALKVKLYDILFSFNLSYFAKNNNERHIFLLISALPQLFTYVFILMAIIFRRKYFTRKHLTTIAIIVAFFLYTIIISSLFERYENMRFRYELQPLFLVLVSIILYSRRELSSKGK